ncbi:MAG: hypothetical protein ACXAEU_23990 [Candidatus Hodarchaeales archaeon]|jgi:hypothetical protein
MKVDTHSLVTMFEGTFRDIGGCIALIDDDGLSLYSSTGCGDLDQFQAISSVLIKTILDSQARIESIEPEGAQLTQATYETEELVFHIRKIADEIFLIVRTQREAYYQKIKEVLDKFMMTWSAIAVLQEFGIEE